MIAENALSRQRNKTKWRWELSQAGWSGVNTLSGSCAHATGNAFCISVMPVKYWLLPSEFRTKICNGFTLHTQLQEKAQQRKESSLLMLGCDVKNKLQRLKELVTSGDCYVNVGWFWSWVLVGNWWHKQDQTAAATHTHAKWSRYF